MLIRWGLFLVLILSIQNLNAQKYNYYTTTINRFSLDLLFATLPNGEIEGYYLDNVTREKIAITGRYYSLGNYWELRCDDPRSPFLTLFAQEVQGGRTLNAFYYAAADSKGFCTLKLTALPEYFETRQDLEAFNGIYKRLYEDLALTKLRAKDLFYLEPNSGKLYFEEDPGRLTASSLLLNERKMIEMNSIKVIIEDMSWETKLEHYQRKLHFQIVSYYPAITVLAICEERVETIETNGDTSLLQRYSFAAYTEEAESWENINHRVIPDYQEERLLTKLPGANYESSATFFRLEFKDQPNTTLYCNVPRTALFVPNKKGEQIVLDWSWTATGFVFR